MRVAIYARHSTALQNSSSSDDQTSSLSPLVDRLGGRVVGVYADPEISGYNRDRPELQRMLRDVRDGRIDVVVAEALDRVARDGEDVQWIGKMLRFSKVRLHTASEGEIDPIKLGVAGMLGEIYLANLQRKTLRGMEAAVQAGRFAGGRAYGYGKVMRLDANGEPIRGLLEIDQDKAKIVRWIGQRFVAGWSSIAIAKDLNKRQVPGPRGGQWNASTIRGDPSKQVGILSNPLYRGRLVWKRREWRKNPETEKRERRYRLREASEWVTVEVPELRIIAEALAEAIDAEFAKRARPDDGVRPEQRHRKRHLLSGLIKCGECGSNFTIAGKDYYRCAGVKERGTCTNTLSVRQGPLEARVLDVLRSELLTPALVQVFVREFEREVTRLTNDRWSEHPKLIARLKAVEAEIDNLAANMLTGVVGPTLRSMLTVREQERDSLVALIDETPEPVKAVVLSHPTLKRKFEEKVATLQAALDDPTVSDQAAEQIAALIDSVTVIPDPVLPTVEVTALTSKLIAFAQSENNPCRRSDRGCSVTVVAGTGFEPVTFRL